MFYPTDTLIYGSKIVIFIWSEPYYAISIESKELSQTYKKYFEFLWKQAKSTYSKPGKKAELLSGFAITGKAKTKKIQQT